MASQSLYRKWRSQTFDEMVGQEVITHTLKNALLEDKLSHAYLFTGPRGTGKTTTARLLAKTVNCTNAQNGEPCNTCQQCREITAGTSFNVIEIDAASNRGIDSIRELREKVMMPPATGKYKIYILDEAHMLTTEAFNALLKTLEEPPDYAIFVMATTDVHKMLPTVLSRCQRFDFKRFTTRQIVDHLLKIASAEKIEIEKSALELIARAAAGGMRDALSLLDQAIAYSGETISLAQVQSMLGVADPRAIWKLLGAIANLESPELLYLIHELSEAGADLRQINTQVIEYWRALLLAKAGADVATIMDLTEDEVNEVRRLIPVFTLEELTECARVFAQNDLMQKGQGTPQLGLELASLECIELHRQARSGQPLRQSASSAPAPAPASVPSAAPPPASYPAPRPAATAPAETEPPRMPTNIPSTPPLARPVYEEPPASQLVRPAPAPVPVDDEISQTGAPASAAPELTLQQVRSAWGRVKSRTQQKSSLLATYISMCDVMGVESDGKHAIIVIRAAKPSHLKFIKEENRPKEVEWAMGLEFSQPCKLRVLSPEQPYGGTQSPGTTSYSLGAVASPPSAYRERSETSAPAMRPADAPRPQAPQTPPPQRPAARPERSETNHHPATNSPPARPQRERENKKVQLSAEELKRKANDNPVVQEVIKTFGAALGNVEQK